MTNAILVTGLASAAFLISHLVMSSTPVRGKLAGKVGEAGFAVLYSVVAFVTLGAMIAAYARTGSPVYLWLPGPLLRHLPLIVMPFALILLAAGYMTRNPSAVGMTNRLDRADVVRGILRVTRHPVMWGILLWAAVHILANGDLASSLFFGGLLLTAGLGSLHLDHRMAASQGERWQRFATVTSHVPFAALVQGRQTLVLAELRLPVIVGLILFVGFLLLHPYLFRVPAY